MKIQLNKRSLFYALLVILFLLLAARYVFQIGVPRMVLTAIIIIMAMVGDMNETIAISMGCIPMSQAVDFYIAIIACAAVIVIKYSKRVKVGFSALLILAMVIWELLHCFSFEWSPITLCVSLAPLLFIAVGLNTDLKDVDYAFVVRIMAGISIYIGALLLMYCVVFTDGNLIKAFTTLGRLGAISDEEIMVGGAVNPNALGIISVFGITGLLQVRFAGQNKKIDNVLLIALLLLGVLSQSKTFLVILVIMFVMVLMHMKANWKAIVRVLIGAILCSVLVIIIMNAVFPQVLTNFMERFQVDDITTGRSSIMTQYHKYISENTDVMFFGIGASDFGEKVTNIYRISIHVPHNSLQEIIVAWGIPGLAMIVGLILVMIRRASKFNSRKKILNYALLVVILAKSMAGQMLTSGYTMIALFLAYLSMCQNFSGEKRSQKSL